MTSTFDAKTREIGALVGDGKLVGKVEVNQIYALAIHSGYWRTGPLAGVNNRPRNGGETHFLTNGLTKNRERYLRNLAAGALEPEGLLGAMTENVEDLARYVYEHAPRDKDALRNSAHPTVRDHGEIVYDRPPVIPRLSKEQLKHRHEFVPRRHFGAAR